MIEQKSSKSGKKKLSIECIDPDTGTTLDISKYEETFIVPAKGDYIWINNNAYEVKCIVYNYDAGQIIIAVSSVDYSGPQY